jgi:hypothetical protein
MTEDEQKRNLDYIRGQLDAVTETLDNIISLLPIPALRALQTSFKRSVEQICEKRDADPVHIDWDRHERSHHPKDAPPPITLHAAGYTSFAEPWANALGDKIAEKEEYDNSFSVLAATQEAVKQDAEWQAYLRLPPEER